MGGLFLFFVKKSFFPFTFMLFFPIFERWYIKLIIHFYGYGK